MKKIIFFIIFYFLYLSLPKTHSFLGVDLGVDLYKNIDKGIYELELNLLEIEVASIDLNEEIKRLGLDCELKDLTIKELQKISAGNIEILEKKIDKTCKKNGKISLKKLNNIQSNINKLYNIYKNRAEEKTQQIHSISRIGLYSDGIEENSGFDLITDIEEIDKIIFSYDIGYNGEKYEYNKEESDCLFFGNIGSSSSEFSLEKWKECIKNKEDTSEYKKRNGFFENYKNPKNIGIKGILDSGIYNGINRYVCSVQNDLSGLGKETLDQILNGNTKNLKNDELKKSGFYKYNKFRKDLKKRARTGYEKVDDSSIRPCNGFFCIIIDFITYDHKLLGGSPSFSLESVLKKSNGHLKKFTNTSLVQSKMTTNNFELGFRDLNLLNLFHMGFQISKKSPPILDLQKDSTAEEKKDRGPLSSENMLREYYKNLGLDYDRANSLVKYEAKEQDLKTIIDSGELSIDEANSKYTNLRKHYNERIKKNDLLEKQVDKNSLYGDMEDFYKQFVELEQFAGNLNDYSDTLDSVIKEFSKKPVHR